MSKLLPDALSELELIRAKIALVVELAPTLYAAGVTSLTVDGIAATVGKAPAPIAKADPPPSARPPPRQHIDPLRDPSTYPTGKVPGFTMDDDKYRTHE